MPYDPYEALKDDWQWTEGVVDAGFEYGPDRETAMLPIPPTDLVKVRPGNPTQNQIAIAASTFGYKTTDKVFTVWTNTLRVTPTDSSSAQVRATEHDKLIVDGVEYIIKTVKDTVYDTQLLVYARRSTKATD
jgi:hypothetical protein